MWVVRDIGCSILVMTLHVVNLLYAKKKSGGDLRFFYLSWLTKISKKNKSLVFECEVWSILAIKIRLLLFIATFNIYLF